MSLENAREFVAKVAAGDEAVSGIFEGKVPNGISKKEALTIVAEHAAAAGWDLTADELEEVSVLAQEIDDQELEAVAGGREAENCHISLVVGPCYATVEDDSWCGLNDACYLIHRNYQVLTPMH